MTFARLRKVAQLPRGVLTHYAKRVILIHLRRLEYGSLRLPTLELLLRLRPLPLPAQIRNNLRERFFFSPADRQRITRELQRQHPEAAKSIIQSADAILRHEFDFLGSGPTALGSSLPWHSDWVHEKQWPCSFNSSLEPVGVMPEGDVKFPWELSRFYHAVVLGQAYWLTNDERYAQEFIAEVLDWASKNPLYRSCNWSNAMEVSIRLSNLIMGLAFVIDSPSYTNAFHQKFFRLLWRHGAFVMHNLEAGSRKTNHYFADFIGILYLEAVASELPRVHAWGAYCKKEFEREVKHQFYEDGVNFEASTSYHRLSTEIAYWIALLFRRQGISLNREVLERLRQAGAFTSWITKPNGRAPQIGDNDNGRIHLFDGMPDADQRDHRHLLALAALLFPHDILFESYRDCSFARCWIAKGPFSKHKSESSPLTSRLFANSGIAVMRSHNAYCIAKAGGNGQDGFGGHAHNDQLSIELCLNGEDIIIDPGTFVYTSDRIERNRFRSTAMHNTVRIDDVEINPIPQNDLFGLPDIAQAHVLFWKTTPQMDRWVAQHRGYERLSHPVLHERAIQFDKKHGVFIIEDSFIGSGEHVIEWEFHCAPEVEVEQRESDVLLTTPQRRCYQLQAYESSGVIGISMGAVSPSYGAFLPAPVVTYRESLHLHGRQSFRFTFSPVDSSV